MAAGLDALHASDGGVGADLVAAAVRGMNETVQYMHARKQTRNQIVMFTFADMMTVCEVADAFCRKAAALNDAGDAEAGYFSAMSRAFARKAVRMVKDGAERCAHGLVEPTDEDALKAGADLLAAIDARIPAASLAGLWNDMNMVGEHLKNLD